MNLYFVRHGESEANLLREFSNRGHKHGLTPEGRRQAEILAGGFRALPIARVYTSPLLRAHETAKILGTACQVPVEPTGALGEFDCGMLESRSDTASWKLYEEIVADWLVHGRYERRFKGGESFRDMEKRFLPFLERVVQGYGDPNNHVVLVGHGGLYRCMLPLVLPNISPEYAREHPIPYAGTVIAGWQIDGLRCLDWCGHSTPRS